MPYKIRTRVTVVRGDHPRCGQTGVIEGSAANSSKVWYSIRFVDGVEPINGDDVAAIPSSINRRYEISDAVLRLLDRANDVSD